MKIFNKNIVKKVSTEIDKPKYLVLDVLEFYSKFSTQIISEGTTEAVRFPFIGKFIPKERSIAYLKRKKNESYTDTNKH